MADDTALALLRYVQDDERDKTMSDLYFTIGKNIPGYLPEGDVYTVKADDAWWAVREELRHLYDSSDPDLDGEMMDAIEDAWRELDGRESLDVGGEVFDLRDNLCLFAQPVTRAELEANGVEFDEDGEVIDDMP